MKRDTLIRLKSLAYWLESEVNRCSETYKVSDLPLPPGIEVMAERASDIREAIEAGEAENAVRGWVESKTTGRQVRFWRMAKQLVATLLNGPRY